MESDKTLHVQTKAFAKDQPLKSWWCIISTTLLLAGTLAGTFPGLPLVFRIFCSLLSGLLIVRLFVIYHDQQHRAILPGSKPAEFFMRLFGIWVLCPSTIWRSSHDYHHAHNCKLRSANIGSYPVMTREQFQKSSRSDRAKYLFMRHPITILFGYVAVFFLGMIIIPLINSPRKHYDSLLALLLHLALVVLMVVFFGWMALMLTIFIPFLIACAIGSYLFYAQHNFPSVVFKDKAGWTYEGAALESSSYLKTGTLMAWFTGNIGYHHIHHLNHRIPFYRLPEVYQSIPELRTAKITSLNPIEVFRCLRLKVWCVESQRMVGVNGL
jgi:acyl-lipid omega-6 desaturase (Delta-12 desaturase)